MRFKHIIELLIVVAIFISFPLNAFSASESIPVLLKGKVLDKFSNKATDVTMTFIDKNGKKFSVTPNIIDGHYEQILMSGNQYEVRFFKWDVARETFIINIQDTEEYIEIVKDFSIKRLDLNNEIYSDDFFIANSAEISPAGIALINQLSEILKFNRGAKLQFLVAPTNDDEKSSQKDIVNNRLEKITSLDEFKKYSSRIVFNKINNINDKNFSVKVIEIKDPLNN